MSQLVFGVLKNLPTSPELIIDDEKIEYGRAEVHKADRESDEVNKVFAANISDRLWFPEISFRDSASIEQEEVSEELRFGAQLHLVLETISPKEKLTLTLDKLLRQDRVEQRFVQRLLEKAKEVMTFPPYQELFQAADTVYNEQDIISSEVGVLRPDILFVKGKTCTVLDYKTGIERREHHQQMQHYLAVLQEMGYTELKGILFYTSEMRFVHFSR
jgi:CRISPR/Cas system-associated exonuclease Cas4 (RecB family)